MPVNKKRGSKGEMCSHFRVLGPFGISRIANPQSYATCKVIKVVCPIRCNKDASSNQMASKLEKKFIKPANC